MKWVKIFLYLVVIGIIVFSLYAFLSQGSAVFGAIGAGLATLLGVNPVRKIRKKAKRETKDLLDTGGIDAVRDDNDERLRRRH